MEFEGETFENVAVRYKGNGTFLESRGSLKRSLKVDLNKYVKGQKLAGVTKLNFHNNVTDASWMNEALSHQLYRDGNVPAPRTAYAKIYVTVAGKFERKYFGLYSLVEEVDKQFTEQHFRHEKGRVVQTGDIEPVRRPGKRLVKVQTDL
jgi:spore coat protein CotH